MSYFSLLRKINYSFSEETTQGIFNSEFAVDITQRFRLTEYFRKVRSFNSNYYFIEDNERPDVVAYKLYGKPDLHWILFIFNEMINPLFEWPNSTQDVKKAIEEKYAGSSIFVNIFGVEFFDETPSSRICRGNKSLFDYENYNIKVGDIVRMGNGNPDDKNSSLCVGKLIEFDVLLGELRILFEKNDFTITSVDTNRIETSEYDYIVIDTENTSGISVTVDIKSSSFGIYKETKYTPHHFRTEDDQLLSPLFYFSDATSGNIEGRLSNIESITQGTTPNLNQLCFLRTILGTYLLRPNVPNKFVISKEMNEYFLNEKKRKILVPPKSIVPIMIKEIKKILEE
jgi:hypothetical protein